MFLNVIIIVAAHKDYWMPEDSMYLPVQVGSVGKSTIHKGWQRDDEGDNISTKNSHFCELTGLYWAWKNLDADYIGLAHYRRYPAGCAWGDRKLRVASKIQIENALGKTEVLLPKKRRYFIETNYSQYIHAHNKIDLEKTKEIIKEQCPTYLRAWDKVMERTSGHRFNMFVMKRERLDEYCRWLFPILFELERRLDVSNYNSLDRRVFGLVSERLLDVWLEANSIRYTEIPIVNLEDQHWLKKGVRFIARKLKGGLAN